MLASVLVGAIRSIADFTQAPDQMLEHLNERIIGRSKGGFATVLCARIAADGSVRIANAGHLPPYLNGQEVDISPALCRDSDGCDSESRGHSCPHP